MARIGRLAGAIVVESDGRWWLVGQCKEPCDFARAGFAAPAEDPARRVAPLEVTGAPSLAGTILRVDGGGGALAALIAERLLVARNGSVSERLWRLVTDDRDGELDARWLVAMPTRVWDVVRDAVLRCS